MSGHTFSCRPVAQVHVHCRNLSRPLPHSTDNGNDWMSGVPQEEPPPRSRSGEEGSLTKDKDIAGKEDSIPIEPINSGGGLEQGDAKLKVGGPDADKNV